MKRCLLFTVMLFGCSLVFGQNPFNIKPDHDRYYFNTGETPDDLVSSGILSGQVLYGFQWQVSDFPLEYFEDIPGETQEALHFNSGLPSTKYYKRKTTFTLNGVPYQVLSNTVKLSVVYAGWEERTFKRAHTVLVPGITDASAVAGLAVGDKYESTIYYDGLGRSVEMVGKEMGSTTGAGGAWKDLVQFSLYDKFGLSPRAYLGYSSGSSAGKYKTNPVVEQLSYYQDNYGENYAYREVSDDHSPLVQPKLITRPGTAWHSSLGLQILNEFNEATDEVHIFRVGATLTDIPVEAGLYATGSLIRKTGTDEQGKEVINFYTKDGLQVLKKVKLDPNPSGFYEGWICTYYIYDDFGQLRFTILPEGVKWLSENNWDFTAQDGDQVLAGQTIKFFYDEKGRTIVKKNQDAEPLYMVYDERDRMVFSCDGKLAEQYKWNCYLYDELDRPVMWVVYNAFADVQTAIPQLQSMITSTQVLTTQEVTNPSNILEALVVDERDPQTATYSARNTIEFIDGFESESGADFIAEPDANAVTDPVTVTTLTAGSVLSSAQLNDPNVTTILKYSFYDHYGFAGVKSFSTNFDNAQAGLTGDPMTPTKRVLSEQTGQSVRVLGTDQFLGTTMYYDEQGRTLQTTEENILSGKDVFTFQYGFDNRVLSINQKHSTANTGYSAFSVVTKNIYDRVGRLKEVEKKIGSNPFVQVSNMEYDDFSRVKATGLAPGYTGGAQGQNALERLEYTRDIQGSLTGINRDYALKTSGSYSKWSHYFGVALGYGDNGGLFTATRLDGLSAGEIWNSQGDDDQRKYDYTYDKAGRFTSASFLNKPKPSDSWTNATIDFSVNASGAPVTYDLNGNIKSMYRKAILPGQSTPIKMDDLIYSYQGYSNKLISVTDISAAGNFTQGSLGDFKDHSGVDYGYDMNGNIASDDNRQITNIDYNILDKPEQVVIDGKGTVSYVYDADGNKLQKKMLPEGVGTETVTSYVSGFVYRGTELQYILFEEGRIRVMESVSENNGFDYLDIDGNLALPNNKRGAWDYFVRDQLSNTRMVLTQETYMGSNICTFEQARLTNEAPVFGQTDANGQPTSANEVTATRLPSTNAAGWTNPAIGSYVSRIYAYNGRKLGANALLKVMAGDKVSAYTNYYYPSDVTNNNFVSILHNLLPALTAAIGGSAVVSGNVKDASSAVIDGLSASNNPLFESTVSPDQANTSDPRPRAFLTVVFFDERFNFVEEGSISLRVDHAGYIAGQDYLSLTDIKAPKNGYAYAFVSNESYDAVFFDNFRVTHEHGRILEENHYYAYGLRNACISSRAYGAPGNEYGYQGDYSELDEDIGWNDFELRNYDAQIGRFIEQDPYGQLPSSYTGMGNDPINMIDPNGGWASTGLFVGMSNLGKIAATTLGGAIAGAIVDGLTGGNGKGILIGAGIGLASNFLSSFDWSYLIHGSGELNFFVTGTANNPAMRELLGLNAPNVDLAWARSKSFFSFGHLKVIRAVDGTDAANQILEQLGDSKTIGSVILESHAHTIDDPDRDPLTTSIAIGDDDKGRIRSGTNIWENVFFKTLASKTSVNTKVFLGNCWSGASSFQPVLQHISSVWNGASVYGQASDNRTMSLFNHNSFTQSSYIKSSEAAWFQRGGPTKKHPEGTFKPYDEWGGVGKYYKSIGGGLAQPTSPVYFGRGASIIQ